MYPQSSIEFNDTIAQMVKRGYGRVWINVDSNGISRSNYEPLVSRLYQMLDPIAEEMADAINHDLEAYINEHKEELTRSYESDIVRDTITLELVNRIAESYQAETYDRLTHEMKSAISTWFDDSDFEFEYPFNKFNQCVIDASNDNMIIHVTVGDQNFITLK
jgi:hypothetical protein